MNDDRVHKSQCCAEVILRLNEDEVFNVLR